MPTQDRRFQDYCQHVHPMKKHEDKTNDLILPTSKTDNSGKQT